jgi:hypothetical protein
MLMTLAVLPKIMEIIVKSYSLIVCWIGYWISFPKEIAKISQCLDFIKSSMQTSHTCMFVVNTPGQNKTQSANFLYSPSVPNDYVEILAVLSKIMEIIVKSYSLIVCWMGY